MDLKKTSFHLDQELKNEMVEILAKWNKIHKGEKKVTITDTLNELIRSFNENHIFRKSTLSDIRRKKNDGKAS